MIENDTNLDRARALLESGDAASAIVLLDAIAESDPEDGRVLLLLGVARSKEGDFAGGVAALRRASVLLPDQAGVWFNLGIALAKVSDANQAQRALERALSLDPDYQKARVALATLAPNSALLRVGETTGPIQTMANAPSYGSGIGQSESATRYQPMAAPTFEGAVGAPTAARRIARGLGWGFVCGQYWTVLQMFWYFVWGGAQHGFAYTAVYATVFLVVCGVVGTAAGLTIGATNANMARGALIGGIAGLLIFALEFVSSGAQWSMLFNVFFWFFTGKYVGANITRRVQARLR